MISNVGEVDALDKYTDETLLLKLYSNNVTPAESDTAATYTEVSGGGYADIDLVVGDRTITSGAPSSCIYPEQTFTFTGVPSVSTVYGYYIVDGAGTLKGSERFPAAVLPFEPIAGSTVKITPKLFAS